MKIKTIIKSCKKVVTKTIPDFAVKHLPEILMITGIASIGTGFVVGCSKSTKLKDVSEQVSIGIENDKTKIENDQDKTLKIIPIYIKNGAKYVKLYWLPVTFELLGIASVAGSYLVQRKRGKELAAAYVALAISSANYRQAVKERYGEEVDKELAYGVKTETIETQKGKKTITTENKKVNAPDDYRITYKKGCPGWVDNELLRESYLYGIEKHCNNILNIKRKLFLNDVYDLLGYPRTQQGQIFGWYIAPDEDLQDNRVIFDITNLSKKQWYLEHTNPDDVYSETDCPPEYFIDFNVECNVLKYMK